MTNSYLVCLMIYQYYTVILSISIIYTNIFSNVCKLIVKFLFFNVGDSILVKPVTAAGVTDVLVLFPGDDSQVIAFLTEFYLKNFYLRNSLKRHRYKWRLILAYQQFMKILLKLKCFAKFILLMNTYIFLVVVRFWYS